MSYSPSEPTPLDVIRGMAGDTSNDTETEIVQDATYLSILARWGAGSDEGDPTNTVPFHRSAAEVIRRVATAIERQPTQITAPGDGSIGWTAFKTKALLEKANEQDALADALEERASSGVGKPIRFRSNFLTGRRVETW